MTTGGTDESREHYKKFLIYMGNFLIKKGLKKGTYKVKIKVTDAGNKYYAKRTKTVTVKIIVK